MPPYVLHFVSLTTKVESRDQFSVDDNELSKKRTICVVIVLLYRQDRTIILILLKTSVFLVIFTIIAYTLSVIRFNSVNRLLNVTL